VSGRVNGGGIVGQNQVCATVRRCYSIAAVSVSAAAGAKGSASQQGLGGIAGFNAPEATEATGTQGTGGSGVGLVTKCVALNVSLASTGGFERVDRIAGDDYGIGDPSKDSGEDKVTGDEIDNYAWNAMPVSINGAEFVSAVGANRRGGADCAAKPGQTFYENLTWDFVSVWKMGSEGYPELMWQ
jgi:hypothetical protein